MSAGMPVPPRRRPPVTKEAWRAFVDEERTRPPAALTPDAYAALKPDDRAEYDHARLRALGHLGPYSMGYVRRIANTAIELLETNEHLAADRVRPGLVIDGQPTLGKTTLLRLIGRKHDRDLRARYGDFMSDGHQFLPVCYVALAEDCSVKALNEKIAEFYAIPYPKRATANELTLKIRDHMWSCGTSLVLIDDLHFVKPSELNGRKLTDHLKSLSSEVAATFCFAGVGLEHAGLMREGRAPSDQRYAQLSGRMRHCLVEPIDISSTAGLSEWRRLALAIEKDLRLLGPAPRLGAGDMPEYLYKRTQGSIGDLVELIRVGATRAVQHEIQTGEPQTLARTTLDAVQLSHRSESGAAASGEKPGDQVRRTRDDQKPRKGRRGGRAA